VLPSELRRKKKQAHTRMTFEFGRGKEKEKNERDFGVSNIESMLQSPFRTVKSGLTEVPSYH
jgi:hypothetical protein